MALISSKYIVSSVDETKIKSYGYKILGNGRLSFLDFMKLKFPGFNIVALLEKVESSFSPTTTYVITRVLEFANSPAKLKISYYNSVSNDDDQLAFVREFSVVGKKIYVDHIYCIIPKAFQNMGLIKPVFQESLTQYVNMDADIIRVYAGLSGGGYTWAKHGFVAIYKKEVVKILKSVKLMLSKREYQIIKRIYDTYYSKNKRGKAFPMDLLAGIDFMKDILRGSDWHGQIDLKNKQQFSNFKSYVFR